MENKKNIFISLSMSLLMCGILFSACNNKPNADSGNLTTPEGQSITFAFVCTDSLWDQYAFVQDVQKEIKELQAQKEAQFQGVVAKLQSDFERYVQSGASLSLNDQKAKEADLQQREAGLEQQHEQILMELNEVRITKNKMLEDSIVHYISRYNKEHNYTFILEKNGVSGVLYGNPSYDITADVIKGLNAEYEAQKVQK